MLCRKTGATQHSGKYAKHEGAGQTHEGAVEKRPQLNIRLKTGRLKTNVELRLFF